MEKALFVIDMQNVCVGKNHADFFKYDRDKLITAVNSRISEYKNENVFYICNVMKDNLISKLAPIKAYLGSVEAEIAEEINVVSKNIIIKYKGDAFSNPNLKKLLVENSIDEIEIVGVDGGGCVAHTALGAIENGFNVILNVSAIGTMFIKKAEKYKALLLKQGAKYIRQ